MTTPSIPLSINGARYCATARTGDDFTGVIQGACPSVPPIIPPSIANQLKVSNIGYGPASSQMRNNVNVTEYDNIWGHHTPTDGVTPWPGAVGSAPFLAAFNRGIIVAAHFRTPAIVTGGMFTYARNHAGSDIVHAGVDIVFSRIAGDFSPNVANPGASVFNALPTDDVAIQFGPENQNKSVAWLEPNTDYYMNVRAHFPAGDPFLLYLVRN